MGSEERACRKSRLLRTTDGKQETFRNSQEFSTGSTQQGSWIQLVGLAEIHFWALAEMHLPKGCRNAPPGGCRNAPLSFPSRPHSVNKYLWGSLSPGAGCSMPASCRLQQAELARAS